MANSDTCSSTELKARLVAIESGLVAFKELMNERDKRYEQRSVSQDTAVAAALATSKEAVDKAEAATEKRLGMLNELRGVVVDQSKEFARKPEVELIVREITSRLDGMQKQVTSMMAHGVGIKETIGYVVGAAGAIVAGLSIYFHR